MKHLIQIATACALLACGTAQAAAPSATFSNPAFEFVDFLTTDGDTVEAGLVDTDKTVFWFQELAGSYYVFFDPETGSGIRTTITFDAPIVAVYYTRDDLWNTEAVYGLSTINYAGFQYDGLEFPEDYISWSGNTLDLGLIARDPGDHLRVITAVPEADSYAMLLAGLGLVGLIARRRLG